MSSSQWTARIVFSDDPDLYFSVARIVSGSIANDLRAVVEPLESQGRDGRRFRAIYRQAPPLVLSVVEPVQAYEEMERRLYQSVGQLVTLYIKAGTVTHKFPRATVTDVGSFRRLGQFFGYGAISGYTRSLGATVTIERPGINGDNT